MITGFNTDIQHGGVTYHVQTEDKGLETPLILSLVYVGGAIIASKRSRYEDLIESGFDEQALTERLQRQHKLICAAIKQGRVDDLKKMAEPSPKRDTAKLKESVKTDEAPPAQEPTKQDARPKQEAPPAPEEQTKPERPARREPAKRAEPPARPREESKQDSSQAPLHEPATEPRPAPPERKREPAPPREPAPVKNAAPASEPAASLLRGEDQYLDETFLHGSTGALPTAQTLEVERTPEPPPFEPPPVAPPPAPPSSDAPPPPVLISPDAVRVIEEAEPLAGEEIYVTLLDDEGEFRAGQLATIKIRVGRGQFGQRAVADAAVTIKVLGTTFRPLILSTRTGVDGVAVVRALLPRFTSGRAAIIIRASSGEEFAEMRRIIHQS